MMAGTFSSWATNTRYTKNWFVNLRSILSGFKVVSEVVDAIAEWDGLDAPHIKLPSSIIQKSRVHGIAGEDKQEGDKEEKGDQTVVDVRSSTLGKMKLDGKQ